MDMDAWFGDRALREALTGLPLALATIRRSGQVDYVNQRFLTTIGREALTPELIADLVERSIPSHVSLRPAAHEGAHVDVLVLPFADHVLLITGEPRREIAELRARVEELERLSTTDRLTGVWNRLQMDRMVDAEMSRAERHHQPVSLILLDVDHFKRINDSKGHALGDQVLRELGERLAGGLRILDSLFRWGGEEFVVLAPETTFGGAEVLAERLRARVAEAPFADVGQVTISLGVAEHLPGESREDWFERVDRLMYRAKAGGRNRVAVDRHGAAELWGEDRKRAVIELTWQDSYRSGHPEIDAEHRRLFDLANRVMGEAFVPEPDHGRLVVAVSALVDHVQQHFEHEERILEAHGFPGLTGHSKAHRHLLRRAREIEESIRAKPVGTGALVEFLAEELVMRHLLTADRAFFELLKADLANP